MQIGINRIKIAKLLALFVGLAGLAVIIGWVVDIGILQSVSSAWISMKFDTAVAFALSGMTLYFIARSIEGEFDRAQVALSITTSIIVLLMGIMFLSALLGIHTGVEELFVNDKNYTVMTVTPGRPSLPTMANFMLIALAGILTMLNPDTLRLKLKIIGFIVALVGALAVSGYCFGVPLMYYYLKDINSAMALHTAALFIFLGAGLICLSD
jgi:hypothetical protein